MSSFRSEYENRINEVMNFVEHHYGERLALTQLAGVAHFSPHHFHRIFRGAVGEAPHAYLTRIRLEKAIGKMTQGARCNLSEIAVDCGFASGSDFSRAFKLLYGFPPKQYSRERMAQESKIRQELMANSGQDFSMTSSLGNPDQFRVQIEDRSAIRVAYVRVIGGFKPDRILSGLERLLAWARSRGLWPEKQLIGRSMDNPDTTPMSRYRYDWCMELPNDFKADRDLSYGHIEANRFAVLSCQGNILKVHRAWTHLYRDWLPESGYQPANHAAMEVFHGEHELSADAIFNLDCCVPIEPLNVTKRS